MWGLPRQVVNGRKKKIRSQLGQGGAGPGYKFDFRGLVWGCIGENPDWSAGTTCPAALTAMARVMENLLMQVRGGVARPPLVWISQAERSLLLKGFVCFYCTNTGRRRDTSQVLFLFHFISLRGDPQTLNDSGRRERLLAERFGTYVDICRNIADRL